MTDEKKKILISSPSVFDKLSEEDKLSLVKDENSIFHTLQKASGIANSLKRSRIKPRLAFTEDPGVFQNRYSGAYKTKNKLLPDQAIKDIRVNDHLVGAILRARGNTMSMFGHLRSDRFDIGLEVEIKEEFKKHIPYDKMPQIKERIGEFVKTLLTCGETEGLRQSDLMSLSEFLYLSAQNGCSFGRFCTEIIRDENNKFNRFRPVDPATIYKALPKGDGAESIRRSAAKDLEDLTGQRISATKFLQDEYAWIQVVDGSPRQAFTEEEMSVYNIFPATDIEFNGYPITPIDNCVNSITTHINITTYNRLYFQNGRAAKGMMVVKSDEINQDTLDELKQKFVASINGVSNAFRTPIFGVGKEDDVEWVGTESPAKDGEFQFLYDQVARNILAAFNMSPDELPGYGHLSKATNSQALSESSNEFKLTASRDAGLRPLIMKFQSFLNDIVFKMVDPELHQLCHIKLSGLDAQTREQESIRLIQGSPLHYTYDQIMEAVDKEPIGESLGGKMPFSERLLMNYDKYMDVKEIHNAFMENPSAMVDPLLQYKRDPFWFQWMQMLSQYNPRAAQAFYVSREDNLERLKWLIKESLEEEN